MKRISLNSKGFTITELLLAALFGLIVMATLYGFFRDQLFFLASQETQVATLEDARGALNLMARELRNAGAWGEGTGTAPLEKTPSTTDDDPNTDADAFCNRVYAATKKLIIVQMDLDGNGDCLDTDPIETVIYELTDSEDSNCPGSKVINRNGECLVANVVTPLGTEKLFSYYDINNTDLGDNPSVLDDIKRVKITFGVQETNPDPRTKGAKPNVTSTLSSSVIFRN